MTTEDRQRITFTKTNFSSADQQIADEVLRPGERVLDRYDVIELLGRGGMGSVFQVRDLTTNKEYALKYLHKQQTTDVVWRRFDIEARTANKLNHPNLIKVYDVGLLPDGQPYFVMDLVVGITLADKISAGGPLPVKEAVQVMIQIAFAMGDAHDSGVIHRDIKPSNIMIVDGARLVEGSVKLVDFGIAKLTGRDEFNQLTLTRTGEIFGSPYYMSPEQCAGFAVDHRSDLYSYGCVLYEALTGAPPLISDSALTQMMKHQKEKPLPLSEASLGQEFPQELEFIVEKLLEKDPNARYQNAHDLARDLIEVEQSLKTGATTSFGINRNVQTDLSIKSRAVKPGILTKSFGPLTLPVAASLLSLGVVVGVLIGRLTAPVPKPVIVSDPNPVKDFRESKVLNLMDKNPYSAAIGGNRDGRDFYFPQDSIGEISVDADKHIKMARDFVRFDLFKPLTMTPSDYAIENPKVFDRFKRDEISDMHLKGCSTNLSEILKKLAKQRYLTSLDLNDSAANDDTAPVLGELLFLKNLEAKRTNISGAALAKEKKLLSRLNSMALDKFEQPGTLFVSLAANAQKLDKLAVTNSKITRADMEKLSHIQSIADLDLTDNDTIDDEALKPIARLKKLKGLDLEHLPITAASIPTLAQLKPSIHQIHVPSKNFTKEQQKELESHFVPNTITWLDDKNHRNSLRSIVE